ncbi:hypothetical protein KGM_206510 [Danaus plexippus plexippus]|uniref:Uncharacterized protein n=1 Tax=Danaus plexippus plexippus TaxID=278856 RepID=A0A212FI63_DANPL|nr:hypothetical protein KGM_206510 [Danaus plexippus plexippus]
MVFNLRGDALLDERCCEAIQHESTAHVNRTRESRREPRRESVCCSTRIHQASGHRAAPNLESVADKLRLFHCRVANFVRRQAPVLWIKDI